MKTDKEKLISLAKLVIDVLETKTLHMSWDNFQNGNGTDIGHHFNHLIRRAKTILKLEQSDNK